MNILLNLTNIIIIVVYYYFYLFYFMPSYHHLNETQLKKKNQLTSDNDFFPICR